MMRPIFGAPQEGERERDDSDRVIDDSMIDFQRNARDEAGGARDRDTARTINGGQLQVPCADELRCEEDVCRMPPTLSKRKLLDTVTADWCSEQEYRSY